MEHSLNSVDTGQMLLCEASDLGLYCFPMSHKKDTRLIWVNKLGLDNGFL